MEWQPIETAPKDRSHFLAWSRRDGLMVMIYHTPSSTETWSLEGNLKSPEPTHWMPLPKAPE